MKQKILPCFLYSLPVLFFIVAYFMIIVSGEDIYQGAHSAPDIISDSLAAFEHSARFSDMYAWSVINFFDYRFSFGIDTIFRIIDVLMAFGIFYFMTDFIVGHRPKFNLKDSLIFNLCFLTTILTINGCALYNGFSMIHNYLIIALATLVFLLPYIHFFQNRPIPEKWWFSIIMFFVGLMFGSSSNITPLAAICTFIIMFIIYLCKKKTIPWKRLLVSWQFWGVAGTIISVILCNIFGNGIENYATSIYAENYEYLSFAQIFSDPWLSLGTILRHIVYNFGIFLLPIVGIFAIVFIFKYCTEKTLKYKLSKNTKTLFLFLAIFVVFHVLAITQIKYLARLLLPGYLLATIIPLTLFYQWAENTKNTKLLKILSIVAVICSFATIIIRFTTAVYYQHKIAWIIDNIENPEITDFCIGQEDANAKILPVRAFIQEDTIGEWMLPVTTNGTTITYCPK